MAENARNNPNNIQRHLSCSKVSRQISDKAQKMYGKVLRKKNGEFVKQLPENIYFGKVNIYIYFKRKHQWK